MGMKLILTIGLARELGLWPPPLDTREETFDTAGGPLRVWVVRNVATVQVVANGTTSGGLT